VILQGASVTQKRHRRRRSRRRRRRRRRCSHRHRGLLRERRLLVGFRLVGEKGMGGGRAKGPKGSGGRNVRRRVRLPRLRSRAYDLPLPRATFNR